MSTSVIMQQIFFMEFLLLIFWLTVGGWRLTVVMSWQNKIFDKNCLYHLEMNLVRLSTVIR
jgi:hypothetical protein